MRDIGSNGISLRSQVGSGSGQVRQTSQTGSTQSGAGSGQAAGQEPAVVTNLSGGATAGVGARLSYSKSNQAGAGTARLVSSNQVSASVLTQNQATPEQMAAEMAKLTAAAGGQSGGSGGRLVINHQTSAAMLKQNEATPEQMAAEMAKLTAATGGQSGGSGGRLVINHQTSAAALTQNDTTPEQIAAATAKLQASLGGQSAAAGGQSTGAAAGAVGAAAQAGAAQGVAGTKTLEDTFNSLAGTLKANGKAVAAVGMETAEQAIKLVDVFESQQSKGLQTGSMLSKGVANSDGSAPKTVGEGLAAVKGAINAKLTEVTTEQKAMDFAMTATRAALNTAQSASTAEGGFDGNNVQQINTFLQKNGKQLGLDVEKLTISADKGDLAGQLETAAAAFDQTLGKLTKQAETLDKQNQALTGGINAIAAAQSTLSTADLNAALQ